MHILTIRKSQNDTEVCVTCLKCKFFTYFDPRPNMCCNDCRAMRIMDALRKCPDCDDCSEPLGDTEWLNGNRPLREDRLIVLPQTGPT
jgi:hypothetical protein